MAATNKIPPDYDGHESPDSSDLEARRLLGAQVEKRGPQRFKNTSGGTAHAGTAAGGMKLRGGSL